jgi:membrane protease YdiL (CAAX protease family)
MYSGKQKAVFGIFMMFIWMLCVAVLYLFYIFPHYDGTSVWTGNLLQVSSYVVSASPIIIFSRSTFKLYKTSALQIGIGFLLILCGFGYARIFQHESVGVVVSNSIGVAATGFIEELVFRGYIFGATQQLTRNIVLVVIANVLLFTLYHVPETIYQHQGWSDVYGYMGFALLACIVRIKSRGLTLPSCLHMAWDIAL